MSNDNREKTSITPAIDGVGFGAEIGTIYEVVLGDPILGLRSQDAATLRRIHTKDQHFAKTKRARKQKAQKKARWHTRHVRGAR